MKNFEEILHVIEPSPLCAIYFFVYPSTKEKFYFLLNAILCSITVLHEVLHKEKMLYPFNWN